MGRVTGEPTGGNDVAILFDVTDLDAEARHSLTETIWESVTEEPPPVPADLRMFTGVDGRDWIAIIEASRPFGWSEGVKDGTAAIIIHIPMAGGATDAAGPRERPGTSGSPEC